MVAAAQPGALRNERRPCDTCGDALIDDVVTSPASSARPTRQEGPPRGDPGVLVRGVKLWGRTPGAVPRPRVTVRALEDRMGYGRDGFVALRGAR